jgi:hypothetical protein
MSEKLRLELDAETFRRLMEIAVAERRPIGWQAEVLLSKAVAEYGSPALRPEPLEVESAGVAEKA